LEKTQNPIRLDAIKAVKKALRLSIGEEHPVREKLIQWCEKVKIENFDRYNAYLYSQSDEAALLVKEVKPFMMKILL
jgi:hypothetical protein